MNITKEQYEQIKQRSELYKKDMVCFLRNIVKYKGESCDEKKHAEVIMEEMKKVGFDEIKTDNMGNVLGFVGTGDKIIAFDGHIDTVGVGNMDNWKFDPYEGFEDEEFVGGRGVSDQLGGIVSSVYAVKIMKEMNLIPDGYKIMVVGSVQEEDCDGLCWQYIIKEDKIKPEFVVSTEPTDGGIYRGQRGRMEIRIFVKGISCHGSAPERGDNAIYKMADIIDNIRSLNDNSADDDIKGLVKMLDEKYNKEYVAANFLGRGTITVSEIGYTSPSRCAVADSCYISIDRRMTAGETWQSCIEEIKNLPACKKYQKDLEVSMYNYDKPSYTGIVYPIECYFPTWWIDENHKLCKTLLNSYKNLYGDKRVGSKSQIEKRLKRPLLDKWTFSTNGVSIMGRNNIPVIGFGPGAESEAHAPNEVTYKNDLVVCASVLATVPMNYFEC